MASLLAKKGVVVGLLIVLFLVGFGVGYGVRGAVSPPAPTAPPPLEGDVTVVALLPLTGVLSTYGENSKVAAELAASEINDWLAARNRPWRLKLIVEDSATDPTTALEKFKTWYGKGVKFFIGPMSSGECKELLEYADANHILYISPSSTSPALAISGDYLYRFCPTDVIQGPAIAKLMWEAGIRHVIRVWRGDTWGDGLADAVKEAFEKLGGTVHTEHDIRYDPKKTDFPTEAATLADAVNDLINKGIPKEQIGINIIAFEEVAAFMEDAAAHDILRQVLWFGSDGTCLQPALLKVAAAAEFAKDVKFCNTIFAPGTSVYSKFEHVRDYVRDKLGRDPDSYAYATYDIVWCLAVALDIVNAYDPDMVKEVLPRVTSAWTYYFAASGWVMLDENGDRAFADYDLWAVMEKEGTIQWVKVGVYHGDTGEIEWIISLYS